MQTKWWSQPSSLPQQYLKQQKNRLNRLSEKNCKFLAFLVYISNFHAKETKPIKKSVFE